MAIHQGMRYGIAKGRGGARAAWGIVAAAAFAAAADPVPPPMGVCPPYQLRDEEGRVIDPVRGVNANAPYSPRQTCGMSGCHDYDKITGGYHFMQGKGEAVPENMAERYNWVTSPGNYGGTWCSPAPLYRQLAPKTNESARVVDMTSFEFVTASCGACHPGGGPLEFDRDGKRYDRWMADPASGFTPGGDNRFDGDYHKARWSESGVIEADCLLCHLPEYDWTKRESHLKSLNFRWAATEGAGLGSVTGSVVQGVAPAVLYDLSMFDSNGFVRVLHLAPEPRNETCLKCHSKPGWKKRGAAFSTRTDVHLAAGLRCVDCHAAGSRASDPRINGREEHQFGKGDDPSGNVRNDLDDTVRSCAECHLEGWNNAPLASHAWLPPLHMETLSCQACHIPRRAVKAALVQASDVFNPAPYIEPPGKRIWTFYDQEMKFWNHYGELTTFTAKDQPTTITRPTLFRYKGKIHPGNRVHSTWVGYEEAGKPGLNMLFMRDYYGMWKTHRDSGGKEYPALAIIADDGGDGVPEINRPEEIDAVLTAVKAHLTATKFPLEGKALVWVMGDRAYTSGTEFKTLPRDEHEATAYASVHKYSHDVAPARAALGAKGCVECHTHDKEGFFNAPVLDVPFDGPTGGPRWIANAAILGLSPRAVWWSATREEWMKPATYGLLALVIGMILILALRGVALRHSVFAPRTIARLSWAALAGLIAGGAIVSQSPDLAEYMTLRRFTLDAGHFAIGIGVLILAVVLALQHPSKVATQCTPPALARLLWALIAVVGLSGALILVHPAWLAAAVRAAYTVFDAGILLLALVAAVDLGRRLAGLPCAPIPDKTLGL